MSNGGSCMFIETEKAELPSVRRTQRVFARIPLSISGKINDEIPFEEESFTIAVNAGAGSFNCGNRFKKVNASAYSRQRRGNGSSA